MFTFTGIPSSRKLSENGANSRAFLRLLWTKAKSPKEATQIVLRPETGRLVRGEERQED
jgi:hypothetical protein